MKKYQLKPNKPAFRVVDGPMTGQSYTHGVIYTEIPAGMKGCFSVVKEAAAPVVKKDTKGDKK